MTAKEFLSQAWRIEDTYMAEQKLPQYRGIGGRAKAEQDIVNWNAQYRTPESRVREVISRTGADVRTESGQTTVQNEIWRLNRRDDGVS
jgi:hypothetical protein